jgi:non-heme chloroperoxidase
MAGEMPARAPDRAGALARWVSNGDVRLHYLDSGDDVTGELAVVFVPGFGEEASEHVAFVDALAPRRCLVLDLRGRGRSDVPQAGHYRFEDHVADVAAVVDAAGLERVHLVSYSRGTAYALGWALTSADRIASVTIGDYPARHIVPPPWFASAAERGMWRGRPITDRMARVAIGGMLADAVAMEFWEDLGRLRQPLLLIRGGAAGAIVDDRAEQRYRTVRPDVEIVCFESSGHDLWEPDPERFAVEVRRFIERAERPG